VQRHVQRAGNVARGEAVGIAHIHDEHVLCGVQVFEVRECDQQCLTPWIPVVELRERRQRHHTPANQRQDHPQRRAYPPHDLSHCLFPLRISG
jgi:hypothetical protein